MLRWKEPDLPRPFKVWLVVPITFCIIAFLLVIVRYAMEALLLFLSLVHFYSHFLKLFLCIQLVLDLALHCIHARMSCHVHPLLMLHTRTIFAHPKKYEIEIEGNVAGAASRIWDCNCRYIDSCASLLHCKVSEETKTAWLYAARGWRCWFSQPPTVRHVRLHWPNLRNHQP